MGVPYSGRPGVQWWGVDLGAVSTISHVVLYPRTDCCSISENQATQLQVRIGNNADATSAENKACNTPVDVAKETRISCSGLKGRYVFVQRMKAAKDAMVLCEVEVFGFPSGGVATTKSPGVAVPAGASAERARGLRQAVSSHHGNYGGGESGAATSPLGPAHASVQHGQPCGPSR